MAARGGFVPAQLVVGPRPEEFPPFPPPSPFPPPDAGNSKFNLWFLGVLIYVAGSCFQALGANIQRYSAVQYAEQEARLPGSMAKAERKGARWCWLPGVVTRCCEKPLTIIGVFLFAGGGIVCSVALIFADESLIAPLVLVLFVFNPIFAYSLNKEPFDFATDGVYTCMVMVGVGLVEGFSPHTSSSYTVEYIEYLFQQSTFISFVIVVVCGTGIAAFFQRKFAARVDANPEFYAAMQQSGTMSFEHVYLQISHGAIAGAAGGLNVTLTKANFAMMIDAASNGGLKQVFETYMLYVVSFFMVITYLLEIRLTVSGLEQVGAMIFLPTFAVVELVVIAMGAMLVFQDYDRFTTMGAWMFSVGNAVALVAVMAMSWTRLRKQQDRENSKLLPRPVQEATDELGLAGQTCASCSDVLRLLNPLRLIT